MELKMKYHYSYFIYPYVIKKRNYSKYIKGLLKNSKFKSKFFGREDYNSIYKFFLPNIRKYMFNSFDMAENYSKSTNSTYDKLKENVFKSNPCIIFEYDIGRNAQAKVDSDNCIFFKIEKIEVICFKTGICFIAIKTKIEDTNNFKDLLNFNAKFSEINSKVDTYRNIKIQTSTFDDIKNLRNLINEITGSMQESEKIDIDINKFLTYSYVCIDEENLNSNLEIQNEFFKFAKILNSEDDSNFDNNFKIVNLRDDAKLGMGKLAVSLFTSSSNANNYTKLPFEFENEIFYTYIFALYEKFYLAKITNNFGKHIKILKATKEFVKFTNELWVHEITNNDYGSIIFENAKEVLELEKIYEKAKEQYDVAYKNFKMKNNDMLNKLILMLLAISIITNIVNFVNLYKLK